MRSANSLRDEMDRNKHERKFHFTPGERTNQRNSTLTAVHNSNHFTASWSRSQDQSSSLSSLCVDPSATRRTTFASVLLICIN